MFKRLRWRLTLLCTLITGVILTGMAGMALAVAQRQQERSGQVAFGSDYNSIVYHLQSQTVLDRSWLAQTENGNRLLIHIEDNGVPLLYAGTWKTPTPRAVLVEAAQRAAAQAGLDLSAPPVSGVQAQGVFFQTAGQRGERYYGAAAVVPTPLGHVSLTLLKDLRAQDAQAALQRRVFVGLAALGTLLLFAFSFWFTGRAVRPIEENHRRQAQFVAAASHELRTPLAVISTSATAVLRAGPEQVPRFIGAITSECQHMSRLVGDLLLLARADAGTWSIQRQQVEVETLLLSTCEKFEGLAAKRQIALSVSLGDSDEPLPPLSGDGQRLGQVLSVLLDNALCYTPAGGRVCLGAALREEGVRLTVADNGPGIPDAHKARIFERFYRMDGARAGKEHYGLGLSIAREIVRLHRGKIAVRDTPGGGCTFVIDLPLRAPERPGPGRLARGRGSGRHG